MIIFSLYLKAKNVQDENGDAVGTDLRVLVREGVPSF